MKENPKLVETRQFKHFNVQQFQNDLSNAFCAFPNFDLYSQMTGKLLEPRQFINLMRKSRMW
jgi:hypothetical protein